MAKWEVLGNETDSIPTAGSGCWLAVLFCEFRDHTELCRTQQLISNSPTGPTSGTVSLPEPQPWMPWVFSKSRNQVSSFRGQERPTSAITTGKPGFQSNSSWQCSVPLLLSSPHCHGDWSNLFPPSIAALYPKSTSIYTANMSVMSSFTSPGCLQQGIPGTQCALFLLGSHLWPH